jgi:hypothetical protein
MIVLVFATAWSRTPDMRSDMVLSTVLHKTRGSLVVLGLAVGAVAVASLPAPASSPAAAPARAVAKAARTVTVDSRQAWMDTGVSRPGGSGRFLSVTAEGKWTFRPGGSDWTVGPRGGNPASDYARVDGQESHPYHANGAVKASLIGKWGKDGETFFVGDRYSEGGLDNDPLRGRTLYLGINDDQLDNNSGSLTVLLEEFARSKDCGPVTHHYDPANGWVADPC